MAAIVQAQANAILTATLAIGGSSSTTGATSPMKMRLTTTAPTSTTAGLELSATGYTTGGQAIAFATASGGSTSGPTGSAISWTNTGGTNWTGIVGLEIIDTAGTAVRWWFGTWSGQPIVIAAGNTFSVSTSAVTITLSLCILVCYNEGMPRGSKPKLTPAQDQEVLAKYRSGMSVQKIADEYHLSITPITAALKRCGETRRISTDYRWQPTPDNCAEVVRLWHEELGVQKIARKVGAGNVTVSRVLREAGITPRFSSRNRRFNKAQMAELAADHIAGVSMAELARRHNCSIPSVRLTLKRAGVEVQQHGRGPRFWTPERLEWLREQHEAGRSQSDIAREIGYSQSAIGNKLRDLGLLVYDRPSGPYHGSWQGGRTVDSSGYVRVKIMTEDDGALAGRTIGGGYVLEHRLVMARKLGRPLTEDETVHHINGQKTCNDPENLQLRQGKHGNGVAVCCLDCGSANIGAVPLH